MVDTTHSKPSPALLATCNHRIGMKSDMLPQSCFKKSTPSFTGALGENLRKTLAYVLGVMCVLHESLASYLKPASLLTTL